MARVWRPKGAKTEPSPGASAVSIDAVAVSAEAPPLDVPTAKEVAQNALVAGNEMLGLMSEIRDADEAAAVLKEVQGSITELERRKTTITKPLMEAKRAVDALFKPALDAWESAKTELKRIIAAEVTKRFEQERAALASGNVTAALAVQPVAARTRQVQRWRIVNESQIPPEMFSPDPVKIELALSNGQKVPGVELYYETVVIAR